MLERSTKLINLSKKLQEYEGLSEYKNTSQAIHDETLFLKLVNLKKEPVIMYTTC